jgi:methionyl-tRNA synthetase
MSKSLGNSLDPLALLEEYGRDGLVYYLFADIKLGSDGDFSRERLVAQKDSNLKNGWSNLVNRVVSILKKQDVITFDVPEAALVNIYTYIQGNIQQENILGKQLLQKSFVSCTTAIKAGYFDNANISNYLSDRYEIVGIMNTYIDSTTPSCYLHHQIPWYYDLTVSCRWNRKVKRYPTI